MTQVKYINKEVLKKALSNGKQLALNNTQMTSCKTNFQAKIQPYLSAQVESSVQPTVQEPAVAQATPAVQDTPVVQNVMNNPIPDAPVMDASPVVDMGVPAAVSMPGVVPEESAPVVNPIEMNTQPVMGIENDVAAVSAPQPVVMETPAPEVSSDVNMMGAQSTEDSDRITREVMQLNVEMSKKIDEEIKMVNKRIAEITSEYNNKIITLTNELISKKKMKSTEMNVADNAMQNSSAVLNDSMVQPVMNTSVDMAMPTVPNSDNVVNFANYVTPESSVISNPGVSPVNSVVDTSEMTQVAEGPTLNLKIS